MVVARARHGFKSPYQSLAMEFIAVHVAAVMFLDEPRCHGALKAERQRTCIAPSVVGTDTYPSGSSAWWLMCGTNVSSFFFL